MSEDDLRVPGRALTAQRTNRRRERVRYQEGFGRNRGALEADARVGGGPGDGLESRAGRTHPCVETRGAGPRPGVETVEPTSSS
jgi:hypothetical protein